MTSQSEKRVIGIRHRVKKTVSGEARPTQLAILQNGNLSEIVLETEQDELDWLLCRYPIEWRKLTEDDDIYSFPAHHIKWRKSKKDEDTSSVSEDWKMRGGKNMLIADRVPMAYDGLKNGDAVALGMGGSGDRFASALSNVSDALEDAGVYRLPSFLLKESCGTDKEKQAECLARLFLDRSESFRRMTAKDRELVLVREQLRARTEAMKARIVVEQQLRASFIGKTFCSVDGKFPAGSIEVIFDEMKANDGVLTALFAVEKQREKELVKTLGNLSVYKTLFEPIEGCGPMIAARLIASIGDVRQFATDAKLKAYCGVHVLSDGRFARKRGGEVANWSNEARQALFLLGDQFNRRPDSVWGKKLREYKVKFRVIHPEAIMDEKGKKKYGDGHIHKMATWRTLTKFVEWLYKEWMRLERAK